MKTTSNLLAVLIISPIIGLGVGTTLLTILGLILSPIFKATGVTLSPAQGDTLMWASWIVSGGFFLVWGLYDHVYKAYTPRQSEKATQGVPR